MKMHEYLFTMGKDEGAGKKENHFSDGEALSHGLLISHNFRSPVNVYRWSKVQDKWKFVGCVNSIPA